MTSFVLIHGAGDVGWSWHLVQAELAALGHDSVAPDLPCEDPSATLADYTETVVAAAAGRSRPVVVGHSYGAFTAPLAAERLGAQTLVLLAGMIPRPGESPSEWWDDTGHRGAVREQAQRDGGLTGNEDPMVVFYHDVPRALAQEAVRRGRDESSAVGRQPWPAGAWPAVRTRFVLCRDDRVFPAAFLRRLVPERLGLVPEEIAGGHSVALSRPQELALLLAGGR